MLTSSFACTPSPASDAITSFAFMFELVPEPVWKTSIGNWSSCSPRAIAIAGCSDPLGLVCVEEAEIAVHPGGGGLDPAEPACDGDGDRLAGDGEVPDRLLGLAAPELDLSLGRHEGNASGAAEALDGSHRQAALEREVAEEPARALGELDGERPAHVVAAGALAGLLIAPAARRERARGAAAQALDSGLLHSIVVGVLRRSVVPRSGDARPNGGRRRAARPRCGA